MKRATKAFVLIELMVVTALFGILMAILVPGYQQQVLQSYRSEATQELLKLAILQQQYQLEHQQFTAALSMLPAPDDSYLTASGRYRISGRLTSEGYVLVAEAVGPQLKDNQCRLFSLDQAGRQHSSPESLCWSG